MKKHHNPPKALSTDEIRSAILQSVSELTEAQLRLIAAGYNFEEDWLADALSPVYGRSIGKKFK